MCPARDRDPVGGPPKSAADGGILARRVDERNGSMSATYLTNAVAI
jgi:hypothetical protein